MLCTSCRRSLLLRPPVTLRPSVAFRPSPSSFSRTVATAPTTQDAQLSQPPPSAISTNAPLPALSFPTPGISQPISTHTLPSTPTAKPQPGKELPKPTKLVGSIPGGAPLFGVAYLKAKPTVLAKEDDEYPEWLWGLIDEGKKSAVGRDAADLSSMTKKQRQKYDRKQERLLKTRPKRIPVHEQSKDLTGPEDDAVVSLERRQEITKSSRVARRKGIRETNFLRSM